jgi:hypothetical protein
MLLRIVMAASLVGCVAEEPDDMAPQEESQPEEPASPTPPAPMSIDVDWNHAIESGGGVDVDEIAALPLTYGGGKAVVQLKISGTVSAPGGHAMKLRINNGTGSWEYGGMKSADYDAASCGSWAASNDLLHGLICTAPGASSTSQATPWSYSMAETFEISGIPTAYTYSGGFHIEVFDNDRRIACRDIELDVTRNDELGGGSSFSNGFCE